MGGHPILTAHIDALEALGPEGEEMIFADLAAGMTVRAVAVKYGCHDGGVPVKAPRTRPLYMWRNKFDARRHAWDMALKERAETHAEECVDIADGVSEDPDAIAKANLRIKARQWLASVTDPERYSKQRNRDITLNINSYHLTAVKQVNADLQAEAKARLAEPKIQAQLQGSDITDAEWEEARANPDAN